MEKIAIITDSNSGISPEEASELGIFLVPMPVLIDEKEYFENIDLTQEQFYGMLAQDPDISTSQPSPGTVLDLWEELLSSYDTIVYIPMSSGLSTSWENACSLSREFDGKVQVVNNQRISVTMRQSVLDAIYLAEVGKTAVEIKHILEQEALESSIYLMVDTLQYLKKGGRITPAAALLGSALNLKPILQIQGAKLDAFKKVRGMKAAKKAMLDAMRSDLEGRFAEYAANGEMVLDVAYSQNEAEAQIWYEEVQKAFPDIRIQRMDALGLSIACHTGPGVLAIAASHSLRK